MANPFGDDEVIPLLDWYENSCVIILGDTGLGKSTLINLCTGSDATTGTAPEAVTRKNRIYDDTIHGDKYPKWMDTVGLNDKDSLKDTNFLVFQQFLRELKDNKISTVHAIIWAINASMREKKEFDEQATQIEAIFKRVDTNRKSVDKVDIWTNVILLCEKSFIKGENSFQGAKAAIKSMTASESTDKITCIQMEDFGRDGDGKTLLDSDTAKRTRDTIMEALRHISSPIYLNFRNMVCLDCGQVDDPRLMMLNCHWEREKKWKVRPKVGCFGGNCREYMRYLREKNTMVCANAKCLNTKGDRAKWSKKKCNGRWKYTQGEYKTCAVVCMIGELEVTPTVAVEQMNKNEIKLKERHNLVPANPDGCCCSCCSCCSTCGLEQ